jgi:flagellar hook protein FlgE
LTEEKDIILFCNPASDKRERLTVRASYDGAQTWPISKTIHLGPAAYSSIAVSSDGTIYVLYENGRKSPYEKISLAEFNIKWLTN